MPPGSNVSLIKNGLTVIAAIAVLVCLPLGGVLVAGKPLARYLEFPPTTRYVEHASFSWPVFLVILFIVLAAVSPFLIRFFNYHNRNGPTGPGQGKAKASFPWWGWGGLCLLAVSWILAWSRLSWFAPWQPYTYFPLWLGYVITVNGLCLRRASESPLTRNPSFFLILFLLSGIFWWYFEYLNRFVQNWHYLGVADFSTVEYVVHATLCFSTVLPAVLSTKEFLESFPRLLRPFDAWFSVNPTWQPVRKKIVMVLFAITTPALFFLPILPEYLFPFLWISPLFIISGFQILRGKKTIFASLKEGDWKTIVSSALAALICGFFWELWNAGSLAHWEYSISFVERFHLFEMPLLGYAGYLPFGLECVAFVRFAESVTGNFRQTS